MCFFWQGVQQKNVSQKTLDAVNVTSVQNIGDKIIVFVFFMCLAFEKLSFFECPHMKLMRPDEMTLPHASVNDIHCCFSKCHEAKMENNVCRHIAVWPTSTGYLGHP